jgi:ribonuclease HII
VTGDAPACYRFKADQLSCSVAAASIVAKVARDRYMRGLAELLPGYGFETNSGYGTRQHYRALKERGSTRWHRQSFKPIIRARRVLD